jgi:enterochelin esterase-like enzyme
MLEMNTRQAAVFLFLLALLSGPSACRASQPPSLPPTSSPPASTPTATVFLPPVQPSATASPTPLACLTQPGSLEEGLLDTTMPPQAYFIYLPPCYHEDSARRYPVLYLLHGQTYTADQWIRLGAVDALDAMLQNGETQPFIIVFPDDRYWNLPPGAGFGQRLVNDLIPYIDASYRTIPNRTERAIGGLSRGGGWALRLGLTRWDLFSIIGLHSPAILQGDAPKIARWIAEIPPDYRPSIFLDIGANDQEWRMAATLEAQLNENQLVHEWRLYSGAHTEEYWSAHVEEYMRWYAQQWRNPPP